jgi:uncharacterized surface anchored protein
LIDQYFGDDYLEDILIVGLVATVLGLILLNKEINIEQKK